MLQNDDLCKGVTTIKSFELSLIAKAEKGLSLPEIRAFLAQVLDQCPLSGGDALLLPPDMTRLHSGANILARELYGMIKSQSASSTVNLMPALGTHEPVSEAERVHFLGRASPGMCTVSPMRKPSPAIILKC